MPNKIALSLTAILLISAFWGLPAYYRASYSAEGYIVPAGCDNEQCHLVGTLKYGPLDGTMQVETEAGTVHVVYQESIRYMVVYPKDKS